MPNPERRMAPALCLAIIRCAVLSLCLTLLLRVFLLDTYHVPTGSMAPALLGNHRACTCPRCGHPIQVGLHPRDPADGDADPRCYRFAACPNCGATGLPLHQAPVVAGQRLLVNKTAFAARSPRRWEIVVFHLFGVDFIKRLLGLPGEAVEIRDGDLYIDGRLCRKTLDEFKAMRISVFDNNRQPEPMTWAARWEQAPYRPDFQPLQGTSLHLDAADAWHLVAYRHFDIDTRKCLPILDEYAYNGAEPHRLVAVHDLMLECDLEIQEGQGTLALGITDGHDHLLARLPLTGSRATLHRITAFSLPALDDAGLPLAEASGVSLLAGKRYHVEWALVDRRLTLRLDGVDVFPPLDLAPCRERRPLVRPVVLAAKDARATVSNIRLWRDVHYTQAGTNGVAGAVVRLGPQQYFVLGDNSARSEDSRYWPAGGAVSASSLLGTPLWPARP